MQGVGFRFATQEAGFAAWIDRLDPKSPLNGSVEILAEGAVPSDDISLKNWLWQGPPMSFDREWFK